MRKMTIERAAARLDRLLEKEFKGLPAREIKQRSEIAHRELDEHYIILMDERRRHGGEEE